MSYQSKQIEALNDLIEINKDRIKGYDRAVEELQDSHSIVTINTFRKYRSDSEKFVSELSQQVRSLGGEPETDSSFLGSLHRTWMDLKTSLSGDEKESALGSCIFGDEAAVKAYEDTLSPSENYNLTADVSSMLQRQLSSIRTALFANKALKELV